MRGRNWLKRSWQGRSEMRVAFVHGINQQDKSSDLIRTEWITALEAGQGMRLANVVPEVPFYGKALANLAEGRRLDQAVAQGLGEASSDEQEFIAAGLEEIARGRGLTDEELGTDVQAVEQGFPHDRRLIALARFFERASPLRGAIAM